MFNLEEAIMGWRERMEAGGIKDAATLEELESHLREEIARLVAAGVDQSTAMDSAASGLGCAAVLKTEFARSAGFLGWLGGDMATRANRILGLLWLGQSGWYLGCTLRAIGHGFLKDAAHEFLLLSMVVTLVLLQEIAGIVGGIWLFRGARGGRRIIRILAIIDVIPSVCFLYHPHAHPPMAWGDVLNVLFDVVTIWWLRPGRKTGLAAH